MAGGAAAFGAYWYRCDNYYIVLYGQRAFWRIVPSHLWTTGSVPGQNGNSFADHLVDYVENSPHFYKSVDNSAYAGQRWEKAVGSSDIVDFQAPAALDMEETRRMREKKSSTAAFLSLKKKDAQAANGNGETDQVEKESPPGPGTPGERHVWTEKDRVPGK